VTQVFSTSEVYFVEEAYDGKYEIVFGSGSLGKSVVDGNIIIVEYLVCNGDETNGATTFSVDSLTVQPDTVSYSDVSLTVNTNSRGGRPQETIDSIKFNAPRNYETQNRAVNQNDYSRILLTENPDLQSVIAFGGENADPPVYGKVYIAVKPFSENFATATRKADLRLSILDRVPLAVDPVMIDPDYTYIIPTITTNFDATKTTETTGAIIQAIRNAISNFTTNNLERFGNRLRYSKFVRALDNVSIGSILNNDASLQLQKRIVPNTNNAERVTLNFNNALRPNTLSSSQFTNNGFSAFLDDDGNGVVRIYRFNESRQKVFISPNAGTIDYDTGQIIINNFLPSAYAGIELKITVQPLNLDVVTVREQILLMNEGDATITVRGEGVGASTSTSTGVSTTGTSTSTSSGSSSSSGSSY